jgi:hypothetical protein
VYAPADDLDDSLKQLLRMRPDVDMPLRPLLSSGHVNETGGREIEPCDEGRRSRARFDRLSF